MSSSVVETPEGPRSFPTLDKIRGSPGDAPLILILLLTIAALWLVPLPSSLTLDETGSYWIVRDGWEEMIDRGREFQGQTIAFFVIGWVTAHLIGTAEWTLRLPALAALGLGATLIYLLARRALDRETGLLAAIVFASFGPVAYTAADFRPYAFALAATIGATLALVSWLDRPDRRKGLPYAFLAALTVYLHFAFSAVLVFHAFYAIWRWRLKSGVTSSALVSVGALLTLLLLPAVLQVISLSEQRDLLSLPTDRSLAHLLGVLAPSVVVGSLALGLGIARLVRRYDFRPTEVPPDFPVLVIGWLLIPPVVLFSASRLFSAGLFEERYLLSAAPGLALGVAWVARSITSPDARRLVAIIVVVGSLIVNAARSHGHEDWRAAIAHANSLVSSSTPVLLHGGFVESRQMDWVRDPTKADYLNAPATYYGMEGRVIPMPLELTNETLPYLEAATADAVHTSDRFMLLTICGCVPYREWLSARLGPSGFHARIVGQFGTIQVTVVEKTVDPS